MSVTILDGGVGQELVRRTDDRVTPLWSTQVMLDHPELVREVHADFFAAGAEVATANTYAVLRDRLARVGLQDRLPELIETALDAAKAARDDHGGGQIAGALGPLRASYRPDLCPPPVEAAAEYAENVALMAPRVDLILIETMSSVAMAEGALRAALGHGVSVWLGLSVDDFDGTRLRSGEPLTEAQPLLREMPPDAVLLNCSRPEAVGQGMPILAEAGLPFGGYANGFTRISDGFLSDAPTVDALQRRDLSPGAYADFVDDWVAMGATIVGGCCETGPAHIAEISKRLKEVANETA